MAIEISTQNNSFVFTDDVSGEEFFRWDASKMSYRPFPASIQLPQDLGQDYVVFFELGTIKQLPEQIETIFGEFSIKGRKFLRTELTNGDNEGQSFPDMETLNAYLSLVLGGFNLAARSNPEFPSGNVALSTKAEYRDTQYNSANPFTLPGLVDTVVPNNGGITIVPNQTIDYFPVSQTFNAPLENSTYLFTAYMIFSPNVAQAFLRIFFRTGLTRAIQKVKPLGPVGGINPSLLTFNMRVSSEFFNSGGRLLVNSTQPADLWDVVYHITTLT